jgi:hypothetical protein
MPQSSIASRKLQCPIVMRGLDPRIHHLLKIDGLPGQARQ